jgi:hypothetical protein
MQDTTNACNIQVLWENLLEKGHFYREEYKVTGLENRDYGSMDMLR